MSQPHTDISFQISARMALLIGRQNVANALVALTELVKNSYDADAHTVYVRLLGASSSTGSIEIDDDGHGMSEEDIRTKWSVIGTDNKLRDPVSPRGRRRVGQMGIGRFALDRLGARVRVETSPEHCPAEPGYSFEIDWSQFEHSDVPLDEVHFPLRTTPRKSHGTIVEITELRSPWLPDDLEALKRDLELLAMPSLEATCDFAIHLVCDEAEHLSGEVKSPALSAALFIMHAELDSHGIVHIDIRTREGSPGGQWRSFLSQTRSWTELVGRSASKVSRSGPFDLELLFFLREADALSGSGVSLAELRRLLDMYKGVRIYRDRFRVKPYGDPGPLGDWLALNARRVRNPAGVRSKGDNKWVIGENQIICSIRTSSLRNPGLMDQTNRQGLIDNSAYQDLRSTVLRCIEVFEDARKAYEMAKPSEGPATVASRIEQARQGTDHDLADVQDQLSGLPAVQKQAALRALESYRAAQSERLRLVDEAYDEELQATMSRLQLLQNLATVGIALSVMGHETLEQTGNLSYFAERLRQRLDTVLLIPDAELVSLSERISSSADVVHAVARFSLDHVARDKRRRRRVDIDAVLSKLREHTLKAMCTRYAAKLCFRPGGPPSVDMFPYQLESLMMNFVSNSLAAFERGSTPIAERLIRVVTGYTPASDEVHLIVSDAGPGIADHDLERIFGMYSTKTDADGQPVGTGLGLMIVKDIVDSLHGTIQVRSKGETLPGAEFTVRLPAHVQRLERNGQHDS